MASLRMALALTLALAPALAEGAPIASARATVETISADGATLSVRTRAGEEQTIHLNPKTRFILVVPAALADVKPGSFIGVAALPGEGAELKAMEVHIFPEAMRGTGEGFRPFDLAPKSRQYLGARRCGVRPQAHRDLQGRRADHRHRPQDPDRRASARRADRSQARRGDHRPRSQPGRRIDRRRLCPRWQGRARAPDVTRRRGRTRDLPE
jgi:hypothetical protein